VNLALDFFEGWGNWAFGFVEGSDHALGDVFPSVDFVFARDEVFGLMIDEANDLVIPGWLFESFEKEGVFAALIVIDNDWDEMLFDEGDQWSVGEDFGPKDLAAASSRNFLKEEEDRFAAFL